MSHLKRLIVEIHHRSIWQVLLVYIGAGWFCFEIIDSITERFGLPPWLPAVAAVLFFLGLPFVVATACVREIEAPGRGAAGAAPDPDDAGVAAAHDRARRRHRLLTWRTAGLAFLVALAAWGVVTTGWLLFAARTAPERTAAAETHKSIAVLPFDNLSTDPDNEFFADGIHEDIILHLHKIADLKVISRTSVMEYKGRSENLRAIAEELEVTNILEGTVRRADGRVRITTQLIDATTDEHLWAEAYDRNLDDVFAVQSDVARKVATALKATLTPSEKGRIEERPTANLEAYDYFLRGREFLERSYDEHHMRIAVEMFENATQLDSSFALAYAWLSQAHSRIYWYHFDHSQQRLERAWQAVHRSLELEPDLLEAHEALGYYYYWGHLDYERALQEFEAALNRQPGDSDLLEAMGFVERRRGNVQVALSHLERALELDPRDATLHYEIGLTHGLLRNYAEAENRYDRALGLAPDLRDAYVIKALNSISWDGDASKARAVLDEAADRGLDSVDDPMMGYVWALLNLVERDFEALLTRLSSGSSEAFSYQHYFVPKALLAAQVYGLMDKPELARQHLDSAVALLEAELREAPEDSRLYGALGIAYAGLGRVEDAIRAGERGVELLPVNKEAWRGQYRVEELARILVMTSEHDAAIDRLEFLLSVPGPQSVGRLHVEPGWDPLRDHPRFQALMDKYAQP
ncbi:MAG: tetratricopeptide repeat protein [Gemmatimonadales bacterium]|jgi:serine/threonine-protein kinase